MKYFVTAIAAIAIFLLAQVCSSSVKSGESPVFTGDSSMEHMEHVGHSMGVHGGHSTGSTADRQHSTTTQAKLSIPSNITPNTALPLVIDIQNLNEKAIASFDIFQEKRMHSIVVSDDLQFFNHIHPTYKGNGRFEVATSFPQPGSYTLFIDYKPAGQKQQVSVLKTTIPGARQSAPAIDLKRTKTVADTRVNLNVAESKLEADKEVTLTFDLQDTAKNQPLKDLQPYLGERGHLVIIQASSPLAAGNYIHAHALRGTPTSQLQFVTQFPEPGKYKLWAQFNRNGKIVIADFWVDVL